MTDREARATPRVNELTRRLYNESCAEAAGMAGPATSPEDAYGLAIGLALDLEAALTAATARAEEAERQANKQAIDWRTYDANTKRADAAESRLAALEAALREPTSDMKQLGVEQYLQDKTRVQSINETVSRIFKAMLSALPDAGKP